MICDIIKIGKYIVYGDDMKKGFTLVELLAVIVIIAIISGVGLIGYRSFFRTGEDRYYENLESNMVLAGNDYFNDHRGEMQSNKEVSLNDLIEQKYMEPVKDSKGNDTCTEESKIIVYKDNGKYNYVACVKCDNYESKSSYCTEEYRNEITVTGITKSESGLNVTYIVNKSYNEIHGHN